MKIRTMFLTTSAVFFLSGIAQADPCSDYIAREEQADEAAGELCEAESTDQVALNAAFTALETVVRTCSQSCPQPAPGTQPTDDTVICKTDQQITEIIAEAKEECGVVASPAAN